MKKEKLMPDLKIKYCLPDGIDSEFDKKIEEFFESVGYQRFASGYNYIDGYRDLAFGRMPHKLKKPSAS